MKSLIIAEKPSVAADLARALGKVPKQGDHFENDEYVISSAVGHLVELEMPEDIDKKLYGFWRLERCRSFRSSSGSNRLRNPRIASVSSRNSSPGRTSPSHQRVRRRPGGELIFYLHLSAREMQAAGQAGLDADHDQQRDHRSVQAPSRRSAHGAAGRGRPLPQRKRLAHRHQRHARPHQAHVRLAGRERRLGWTRSDADLAIIFGRELEIRSFQPRSYWRVTAVFQVKRGSYEGVYQRPNFKKADGDEHDRADRIWDQALAEAVVAACQGHPPPGSRRTRNPPPRPRPASTI